MTPAFASTRNGELGSVEGTRPDRSMAGTLFVVATPIGNLEDITLRALRVLREVTVIASEDTRRTSHLLARYAIATPTTSLHEHNERQKSPMLIRRLLAGDNVAVVSDAGTPAISDPGAYLVELAVEAGIRVEPIPGPSAIMAALSVLGRSPDRFTFLGFPPARSNDRKSWLERLAHVEGTAVFFEAPHPIRRTLEDVRDTVGEVQTFLTRELTKAHEQLVRGPISTVLDELRDGRGEYTILLDIGRKTGSMRTEMPGAQALLNEFGEMTKNQALSRRAAVAALAKRYSVKANDLYSALEAAKKSGR